MAGITTLGTAVTLGFGTSAQYCITGYLPDTVALEQFADIQEIRDCNNDLTTKLISNKGVRIKVEAVIKSGTAAEAIRIGDVMTVNSVKHMVEACTVTYSREAAKISLTLVKEDVITYA